jgi:Ca2+:H+ antiporter
MTRWLWRASWLLLPAALVVRLVWPERSVVIFAVSALSLMPLAKAMGDATEDLAEVVGSGLGALLNATFGNAAENWAAVRAAWRNHVNLTLGITSGSSTQIPLFVAPVLILASLVIGRPMTLVFEPLELLVLALSTAIFAYISLDGESHWLEGVLLLALYLMTAAVFFLDPVSAAPLVENT